MGMDINQIMELWRSLSPRLARGIPGQELSKDEQTGEKKSDKDSEDETANPIGNRHEEDDV